VPEGRRNRPPRSSAGAAAECGFPPPPARARAPAPRARPATASRCRRLQAALPLLDNPLSFPSSLLLVSLSGETHQARQNGPAPAKSSRTDHHGFLLNLDLAVLCPGLQGAAQVG